MQLFDQFIAYLFSMALTINAGLFVLQFIRIISKRTADGVSPYAFGGFWLIQSVTATYGWMHHDDILFYGTLLSLFTCSLVIIAIIYFQWIYKSDQASDNEPSLHEIIASIPANVYWINRKGQFLGCNNQMLNLLQLNTIDEYRGKTYEDLYEPEHIDVIKQTDQQVMKRDQAIALEEIAYPYKVYWSNKIPLHNSRNEVVGLLGVSFDITDRKHMEHQIEEQKKQAETANQAKTEFIYNIRHDIRTPLTNMVGLAQILAEREQDSQKKLLIDDLLLSSQALLELFNDLLTFTNLEDNAQPIELKYFDLRFICQQIQSIMSASLHSKSISLNIEIDQSIPCKLVSDPMRIHRILLNLVGNAIKFTHQGSVTIRATAIEKTNDELWLALYVQDTGIGIPQDKLQYIFGKFNRIEQSANSDYPGSGLGLAIVKRFAEDLGGYIRVSSVPHEGSTFTCTFPCQLTMQGHSDEHTETCIVN